MAAASSVSAAHTAAPPSQRRPLLVGSPQYGEALAAQRANLERFVHSHPDLFSKMRYQPWTTDRQLNAGKRVDVRRSTLVPGIRGVYLKETLQTKRSVSKRSTSVCAAANSLAISTYLSFLLSWRCRQSVFLVTYPGVLMTEELLDLFNQQFYCPTALRLPSLDYVSESGQLVEISIVGDPLAPGCIINDGAYSGQKSQSRAH